MAHGTRLDPRSSMGVQLSIIRLTIVDKGMVEEFPESDTRYTSHGMFMLNRKYSCKKVLFAQRSVAVWVAVWDKKIISHFSTRTFFHTSNPLLIHSSPASLALIRHSTASLYRFSSSMAIIPSTYPGKLPVLLHSPQQLCSAS